MKKLRFVMLALLLAGGNIHAAEPQASTEKQLVAITQAVADAQLRFDHKALDAMLAPDYVEISPIGDVDERAEVLGFYTPQAKAQMLAGGMQPVSVAIDAPRVRVYGDQAIVIARQVATLTVKNARQVRTFRMQHHFRRLGGKWLLQSAQYTPMRSEPGP